MGTKKPLFFIATDSCDYYSENMSLKVNFATHGKELTATYKAVLNGNEDTNWSLFGYDKGTNDLKVLGSGGKTITA